MPVRRLTLAGTAVALVLSGCSGSGSDDPATTTASAPDSPSSSSEASFPTPSDTGEPFDREDFVGRIEQAVEDHPTVEITVDVVMDGQTSASAKGTQDLEQDALDMEVVLGGQTLAYRYVDGRYFLAQPPKWLEVDETAAENPVVKSTLDQVQILSMKRQLKAFTAGVTTVGDKGTEDVNGEATTHYTAQVDTAKALEAVDAPPNDTAPKTLLYDVWLDEDDLIRKMSFTQGSAQATMLADRWGEPVDIEVPAPSEIAKQ